MCSGDKTFLVQMKIKDFVTEFYQIDGKVCGN